jgi:hypothetical protein
MDQNWVIFSADDSLPSCSIVKIPLKILSIIGAGKATILVNEENQYILYDSFQNVIGTFQPRKPTDSRFSTH